MTTNRGEIMQDEPIPQDEPIEDQPAPATETGLNPIDTLPHRLGFEETEAVHEAGETVGRAIAEGTSEGVLDAWIRWSELAGAQADAEDPDGRTRTGLLIAKAALLREAGEPVAYLGDLLDAEEYAASMGYSDIASVLAAELGTHAGSGEMLQAEGEFKEALDVYVEREQDPELTIRERGLLNLRMAECYVGLRDSPNDEDSDPDLLEGSLATAMECLAGEPEQRRVERLLDKLNQEDNDAAEARKQLREHFEAEGRAITEREARTREEELENPLWQTVNDTIEDMLRDTPPVTSEARTYKSTLEDDEETTHTKVVRRREGQPYGGWGGKAFRKVLEEVVDTYVYGGSGRTESKKRISLYDNDQGGFPISVTEIMQRLPRRNRRFLVYCHGEPHNHVFSPQSGMNFVACNYPYHEVSGLVEWGEVQQNLVAMEKNGQSVREVTDDGKTYWHCVNPSTLVSDEIMAELEAMYAES